MNRSPSKSRASLVILLLMIAAALALSAIRYGPATAPGRAFIENTVDGTKVWRLGRLRVWGLRGDPWRRFTVARLTITDRRGVWLEAHDVSVRWRAEALWGRRVHVSALTARAVTVLRQPMLLASTPPSPALVSVRLDKVAARIATGPGFSDRPGLYDLKGALRLDRGGAVAGALDGVNLLHLGDTVHLKVDLGRSKRFTVEAVAREAPGGAMAASLGLAADQAFTLDAHMRGGENSGRFSLLATVGASRPAEGSGAWTAAGGWAVGHMRLAASRLLAGYQRAIGPEARFRLTGRQSADGFHALVLNASSDNLSLAARGEADIGHLMTGPHGVAIDLRLADPNRVQSLAGMGPARLRGGLGGDAKHWVFTGQATADRMTAGGFSLARLTGPVRLEAKGGALSLLARVQGEGGAGGGLAAALLGARPRAVIDLVRLAKGQTLLRRFTLDGAGVKLAADGRRGLLGDLSFKGEVAIANLAAARPGARGLITARWSAGQLTAAAPWTFGLDARGANLITGLGQIDRTLGPTPRLRAQGTWRDGVLTVAESSLDGAAGALNAAGLIGPAGALKLSLDWRTTGPLIIGPLEVAGAAKGSGALTGDLTAPKMDLMADFKTIDMPYLPLRDAHLIVSFLARAAGVDGHFNLAGKSDYGPATASSAFRFGQAGLDVTGLDLNAGGVTAAGALALRDGEPSNADLTFAAGPGAFLARGRASGRVRIVDSAGGARASVSVQASDAALRGGGVEVGSLRLTADGPLARLPYQATASGVVAGGPWRLAGSGIFSQANTRRTVTFSGSGRLRRADWRTVDAAQFTFAADRLTGAAHLAFGSGRADLTISNIAEALDVHAALSNLSLTLLDPDYVGRVDGALYLAGRGPALTGDLDARLLGVGGRDLRGGPALSGEVKARLTGGAMAVDGDLTDGAGSKAHVDLTLPAEASAAPFRIAINRVRPISGRFAIDGELGPLWDLTMGAGRTLTGRVVAAGTLGGTLADPRAVGTAALDNGRFVDSGTGLKLRDISLRAVLRDNGIEFSQFSGTDGARGTVSGAGRVSLLRDGVSSFRLDLKGFRLIDNDIGQAAASGAVSVNRAADGKVRLAGALTIDRAQIAPNPPVPSGVVPMDVVEIHRPAGADESVAEPTAREAPVALAIGLAAPGGIFIKGRGLNVEFSLDARVAGTTDAPLLTGTARVVRGDYDFAGRRFQFDDRGVVYLGSTAQTIRLDLTATREDPNLTAVIHITGTAAKPIINLTSTPVLPKDEVLSQVLFGASAAQLTGLQAAQLASALSGLAGGGGFDIIGGLRNFAHLDRLAIGADPTGIPLASGKPAAPGTTIYGGKYLTDKVYLELSGGGREGPGAQIEWRVKKHLSVVSKVTSQGDSQISVRWRKDY